MHVIVACHHPLLYCMDASSFFTNSSLLPPHLLVGGFSPCDHILKDSLVLLIYCIMSLLDVQMEINNMLRKEGV